MEKISLRLYALLVALLWRFRGFAQYDDDEDYEVERKPTDLDELNMEDYLEYQPIHFSFKNVVFFILVLVACYVFGKIWKGCSYLILVIALLFFYLTR